MNTTIAKNIGRLSKDVNEEAVMAAAKSAGAHELILSFPDGYSTNVGPGGMKLSGGQRQRIGLARAIYGDPFILILDEPSSHLDPDGERALVDSIRERSENNKITIVTAHNPSFLRLATKLIQIENGRMTISGPKEAVLTHIRNTQNAEANTKESSTA